ncbi:response regulator [Clostridium estertheticum]|uniref:Stage 0 sporulation protein A homolog n=1 Tax=Clostridium estertheticum TaxID=238834 RepID=A0A7Y3SX65_9CLOT|nr:response regulator [Clostridium estertheticum]NNU76690.1 response regulator [Clostridium estertheticum]
MNPYYGYTKGGDLVYKVLFVDDESMALELLKYILDWEKLGFSVCAACWNGKEAVDAIDKYEPDVIITDIKMPVMDGLDLIGYAREHGKENIKFIVVSGYGEFEYAKKAMKYGVRFYLQKPILQEEILEIIIEVKQQLDQIQIEKEGTQIDQKVELNGVLIHLIQGHDSKETFEYLKSVWDGDTLKMGWNCIVIELESTDQLDIQGKFKNTRLKVRETIDKVVKGDFAYFTLEQSLNTFIILVSLKNEKSHESIINRLAQNIYQSLDFAFSSGFTIGVGENVVGIKSIKHSYGTALESLGHRFYRGLNCLIFYTEVKEKTFNFEFNEIFMSSKVFEAVEEVNSNKIKNIIDTTFEYFKMHRIHPDIVIMFTSNMICKINNLIYESDHKAKCFIDNHTIRELKEHERTMDELKKVFEDFCIGYCEYFIKIRNKNSESNVIKIEVFIKENYKRNITIRELSEKFYMHPTYMGQLFTRKFGMTFNEYIHGLRIEEGKRLMKITNLKNHEIAEVLGYSNYSSFLKQFQKYTGIKPTEFRNSKRNLKIDHGNTLV